MLKTSSCRISAFTDTSDHGLSHPCISPGTVVNGLTGMKLRWWSLSLFSFGTDCTREFSNVPTDKNPRRWGRTNVGAATQKLLVCGHMLIWTLFLFWCGALNPEVRPGILDTPCTNRPRPSGHTFLVQQPPLGQGLHIHEVSRSH